jgi:divalent metal cation (Fe/Co/Zn/Cd) transporter
VHIEVDPRWYTFLVVGLVLVIDVARTVVSLRTARRFHSAALLSNALHFGSDFAGSLAVLAGLIAARAGWQAGDSVAALFVAALVLSAAVRLMRRNVDVLMDRAPADAEAAARLAIANIVPPVNLKRLRMRTAAGRYFADVVIGVSPEAAVGQGHAAADRVEEALERALPETDVVVHVEPQEEDAVTRELAHAAAMRVPRVREIHNISVLRVDGRTQVSLHLKLPGDLSLDEAHAVASEVEDAIEDALPGVDSVQTHLEPLAEEAEGTRAAGAEIASGAEAVARIVRERTGAPPRELRFLQTDDGLVVFLTLGLDPAAPLAEAHSRASEIEEQIRVALPSVSELIVHTEP